MKSIIISSVLSLLLTGNSPVRFQYPSNIITTPYGTCTWYYSLSDLQNSTIGSIFNGMSFASDARMTIVNYTFNGQATGTFDLPIYSNVLTRSYDLFVQGGVLLSVPDLDGDNTPDALRFKVNDTRQFTCLIIHPNWSQPATINLSLLNQNINITDTLEGTVADILSYTSGINGYTQTINSSVTTIKNILTQSLGSYVSQGGSLYTDMQSLINAFNLSNQYSKNLNIPVYSYSAYYYMSKLGLINANNGVYNYFRDDIFIDHAEVTTFDINNEIAIPVGEELKVLYYTDYYDFMFKFLKNDNTFITSTNRQVQEFNGLKVLEQTIINNDTSTIRLNLSTVDSNRYHYVIPIYIGLQYPDEVGNLYNLGFSNTYTKKLDEITNAIKNMAVNVNNLTVNATGITYNTNQTQVDNSVTSYQNNINVVNNIENNFKNMFDNANQNYNVDNIPITNDMINTNNFMNNIATQLYGIDIIKYPVTLLLLGIVLIGLLG